jgi:hypothetical protein
MLVSVVELRGIERLTLPAVMYREQALCCSAVDLSMLLDLRKRLGVFRRGTAARHAPLLSLMEDIL